GVVSSQVGCETADHRYTSHAVPAADAQRREEVIKSNRLIVPGERIGPIRLGMGMDEVRAVLGQPDETFSGEPDPEIVGDTWAPMWHYKSISLLIWFSGDAAPIATSIATVARSGEGFKPKVYFRAAEGVQIGTSSYDVKRAYGTPLESGPDYMRYEPL